MATTYAGWVADGKPYKNCQPGIDIRDTLGRTHGLVVYAYPDESHLRADPPQDHTPFSHTPWPGPQPYPYGRAIDIMPDDDVCDWRALGEQIIADIDAGVPGTEAIVYVNYTTRSGRCLHVEYKPHKAVSSSSDTGHIHISFRTDFVNSHALADYDPVARLLGDDVTDDSLYGLDDERRLFATAERVGSTVAMKDDTKQRWVEGYDPKNPTTEPNEFVRTLKVVAADVDEIKTALASTSAPVLTDEQLQALAAQLAPAVAAEVLRQLRLHPLAPTV